MVTAPSPLPLGEAALPVAPPPGEAPGALAVVPVRDGKPAVGGPEAIAEAGGRGVLVGDGARQLAEVLLATRSARVLEGVERDGFRPGEWAEMLAPIVGGAALVILPGSPDGRDLAPRLSRALGWPLLAGAIRVTARGAAVVRREGRQIIHCEVSGPFVATLLPGSRSVPPPRPTDESPRPDAAVPSDARPLTDRGVATDGAAPEAELVELLDADPAVMDLREARRIIAGGAGLGAAAEFKLLATVASAIGGSVGATRAVTDAGILPDDRQIGTTGVTVRPRCYIALGISGAAQHVGGLGSPEHVITVNLDRSCPMMSMADLALVADAPAVLRALAARLAIADAGRR